MTLFNRSGDKRTEPPNSQSIPLNSSFSLPDKVIFQFIIYYYEDLPKYLIATPNAADLAMDLLPSRSANTNENQSVTNLKPPTANCFPAQVFVIYAE